MRIHLLCDHKWRDLPNLTVIKLELEALGHRVLLSTTKDAVPMMQAFRPDCVVFNHLFGRFYAELSANLRDAGVCVVMLPTEGAMRPEFVGIAAGEFADFSACQLFLNWSEPAARLLRQRWRADESAAPVVGCTRFDFYHPRFAGSHHAARCILPPAWPRSVAADRHLGDPIWLCASRRPCRSNVPSFCARRRTSA